MITIVTDSTVYLKRREAERLGVRIVPMRYELGRQTLDESYSDENGDFEVRLASQPSFHTSQPNIAAFLSTFEDELSQGNDVLCIMISSRLSGAFQSAYIAAKQVSEEYADRITILDGLSVAGGTYLLVREARRMLASGVELAEVVTKLKEMRSRLAIAFSVDDMAPLRRSGRIGFVRMGVGTILNIRPILMCKDGAVVSDSVVRGEVEIIKKLISMIPRGTDFVVINYLGNGRTASNLYNVIKNIRPNMEIKLQKLGPVLGIHLGLRAVGVAFLREAQT